MQMSTHDHDPILSFILALNIDILIGEVVIDDCSAAGKRVLIYLIYLLSFIDDP
jgi:hypothetical protein